MIMNVVQAANCLGVTRQRVIQMIHEGKLIACKDFGQWRIDCAEVVRVGEFMRKKKGGHDADGGRSSEES